MPVFLGGSLWGAITAGTAIAESFTGDTEHALERLAELASAALVNAQAQRQLLERKATLEAALSSMTDAVFVSDEPGRFLHFNEAFTTFHRFQTREQTLRSLEDYPAILEVFMRDGSLASLEQWAVPRALRGEVGVEVEYGLRRKDTGERWVASYNFAPIRCAEGEIIGSVVTGRDITEQKRAEAERRRTHRDLEEAERLARLGSWTWDPNSRSATWSAHVFTLFGRDPANGPAIGEELLSYVNPEHRARVSETFGIAPGAAGEEFEFDFVIRSEDGEERVVHAIGRPDPARPGRYRGTFQDVSDQRRVERAEAANRANSEFLSRISHELRTPLNAISGFSQLLAMDDLKPDQAENVSLVLKGAEHMLALIDEVLDLSRIEAGKLSISLEAVALGDIVRDAAALIAPLAAGTRVTIEIDDSGLPRGHGYVHADAHRLKQVVLNLLSNAVKYNRPGGRVLVRFELSDSGRVRALVTDTGIGIRAEHMASLFVPFERLGAGQNAIEGTGLGLTLSKGMIEAMGGAIEVSSKPGVGSTFTIELAATSAPCLGPQALERQTHRGARDRTEARKILHIEDNLSNLKLVERIVGAPLRCRVDSRDAGVNWPRACARTPARPHHPRPAPARHPRRRSPQTPQGLARHPANPRDHAHSRPKQQPIRAPTRARCKRVLLKTARRATLPASDRNPPRAGPAPWFLVSILACRKSRVLPFRTAISPADRQKRARPRHPSPRRSPPQRVGGERIPRLRGDAQHETPRWSAARLVALRAFAVPEAPTGSNTKPCSGLPASTSCR